MERPRKTRRLLPAPPRQPQPSKPRTYSEIKNPNAKREAVKVACEGVLTCMLEMIACRKRKVKCDGHRPSCRPCISGNIACEYSLPEGMSTKEVQIQQLERLRRTNIDLLVVLDNLRRASGPESEATLKRIRQAQTLDDAVDLISHAMLLLPAPTPLNHTILISGGATGNGGNGILPTRALSSDVVLPVSSWTTVCRDNLFLTHLLDLFWTWDNTLSQMLDRSVFLEGLRSGSTGGSYFCSDFLVNSLLAVASMYSRRGGCAVTPSTRRGQHFADKALQQLETQTNQPNLTLLQGLAMLAVFEAASGNLSRSANLLDQFYRVQNELQLHDVNAFIQRFLPAAPVEKTRRTVSLVAWGFYSLSTKFRLCFGRLVSMQKPRIQLTPEVAFSDSDLLSGSLWTPYPSISQTRLSYSKLSFSAGCGLAELSEGVLTSAAKETDDGSAIVPDLERLRALYPELMRWKAAAPDMHHASFCNLPSFVTLFVTFDMILLRLLEPFSQQPFPGPGHPPATFWAALHGTSLMSTIWSYRSAYGLRDDYWLAQACSAAATSVLPNLEPGSVFVDAFTKACHVLFEAGEHLPLANQLLQGVRAFAAQNKIELPASTRKIFSALAARSGNIRLKDVRLALSAVAPGAEVRPEINRTSAHDVIFSDMIGDITRINFLN